jgi:agmatine/peptidylarginine deiminase
MTTMPSRVLLWTLIAALCLSAGTALAQPQAPTPARSIPRALITSDELANPERYHPRRAPAVVPSPGDLPPPPPAGIVRPGEFEPADSTIFTVINYGPEYFPMWRDMIAAFAPVGHSWIIADFTAKELLEGLLYAADVPESAYSFLTYPVDSIWIRDYGPEFAVEPDGTRHVIDFAYMPTRPLDDAIPLWVAASDWIAADGEPLEAHSLDHGLNGGNLFSDGAGTCFFADIVFGYEKPSGWTYDDVEQAMLEYLGCEQMIVLNPLCLDGTGQVGSYAKALGPTSIVLGEFPPDTFFDGTQDAGETGHCGDSTPNDYQDMEDNAAVLEASGNLDDDPWQVTRIPMLEPVVGDYGWLYRTYASAELFNDVLAMPTYYEPHDDETAEYLLDMEAEAIAAFEDALPGVEVHAIDADHLIQLAGALHSIAHEIPAEASWDPPATYCGDGLVNGGEDCDGADLDGQTCQSLGYDGGELACGMDCEHDTSECIGSPDTDSDVDSDSDSDGDSDSDSDGDSDSDADSDDSDPHGAAAPIETRCDCRAAGGSSAPSLLGLLL